jgi:hypothetical protein
MARVIAILSLLVLVALPAVAAADDPPASRRSRRDSRVLRLPEIVIPGQIHHPAAAYVLQRARPRVSPAPLHRSFVNEVVRSTWGL